MDEEKFINNKPYSYLDHIIKNWDLLSIEEVNENQMKEIEELTEGVIVNDDDDLAEPRFTIKRFNENWELEEVVLNKKDFDQIWTIPSDLPLKTVTDDDLADFKNARLLADIYGEEDSIYED